MSPRTWVSQVYKNTGDFWFFFRTDLVPGIHHQTLFKSTLTLARVPPFEEEEKEIGIASDVTVVKVNGEDPATPGSLRSIDTRKPQDRNDSPISV